MYRGMGCSGMNGFSVTIRSKWEFGVYRGMECSGMNGFSVTIRCKCAFWPYRGIVTSPHGTMTSPCGIVISLLCRDMTSWHRDVTFLSRYGVNGSFGCIVAWKTPE